MDSSGHRKYPAAASTDPANSNEDSIDNTLEIYTINCLKQARNDCVLDTLGRQMYALQKVE